MADYDLSLTGAQVDAALNKAHNPDTQPITNSSNLITSGGVKTAVEDITLPIDTDLTSGINTDSTVPSSLAVENFVTSSSGNPIKRTKLERYSEFTTTSDTPVNIPGITVSENLDLSWNGNGFNINPGLYIVNGVCRTRGGSKGSGTLPTRSAIFQMFSNDAIGETLSVLKSSATDSYNGPGSWFLHRYTRVVFFSSNTTIRITLDNSGGPGDPSQSQVYVKDFRAFFHKLI